VIAATTTSAQTADFCGAGVVASIIA